MFLSTALARILQSVHDALDLKTAIDATRHAFLKQRGAEPDGCAAMADSWHAASGEHT